MLWNVGKLACRKWSTGNLPGYQVLPSCLITSTNSQTASIKILFPQIISTRLQHENAFDAKDLKTPNESKTVFPAIGDLKDIQKFESETSAKLYEPTWTKIETKWHRFPKIYMALSKWYLSLFVVMTADAGYCLAPVMFDHKTFLFATVGTMLCACSANTFNQIAEVPYDAQMDRTKNRPLVRNIISPLHATIFGLSSAVTGVSCLYFGVNGLTAALGFANILLYAAIYTPLKRKHWLNTWAGSLVGAIPPIMGWTAATGTLDPGAFVLAGILYSWQFPHFFALAWRRRGDYARGSYHMLPLSHPEATKLVVVAHSLALCGLSIAAPLTGVTSWGFVTMAFPFNAWLMRESVKFYRKGNSNSASKLYKCSLYYILAVSLGLVIDRKVVTKLKQKEDRKLQITNVP